MRTPGPIALMLSTALLLGAAPSRSDTVVDEIRPGDTLSHLALRNLGDATLWPAIYLANRDQIKDPSMVYPGQLLAIPDVEPAQREALRREARSLGFK